MVLIDDEPAVRTVVRRTLESAGMRVTEAANGAAGLRTLQRMLAEPVGKPHLVITDLIMPELSGYEVADVLAIVCPDLPVLCLSGYDPSEARLVDGRPDRRLHVVQKPFEPGELLRAVQAIIAEKRAARPVREEQREIARRLWEAMGGEVPLPRACHADRVELEQAVKELRRLG